jgi:hypothetical protein
MNNELYEELWGEGLSLLPEKHSTGGRLTVRNSLESNGKLWGIRLGLCIRSNRITIVEFKLKTYHSGVNKINGVNKFLGRKEKKCTWI